MNELIVKKVALLRGINVGGKNRIRMLELKALFELLGCLEVITYIQTGNVIFISPNTLCDSEISRKIEKAIINTFLIEVVVIVISINELKCIVNKNPLKSKNEMDINQLYVTFLKDLPSLEDIAKSKSIKCEPDIFEFDGRYVFVFCDGKYHLSKLTNAFFEKKLKVYATTRNWKSILKIVELGS